MISRIWRVYRVQLTLALRSKTARLGPLLLLLAIFLTLLLQHRAIHPANGYAAIALATPFALNTLGLLCILLFNASLVAAQHSSGTLRQALLHPLLRHEILVAKLLLGISYALLILALTAAASWAAAATLYDLHGVIYGGELLYSHGEMLRAYLIGALLAIPPLAAAAAFALMVSAFARGSGAAIAATLGAWVLADALKYPLRIETYVFTTYLDAPWEVFAAQCDGISTGWYAAVGPALAVCGATFFTATAIATLAFWRRNLG